MLTNREMVNFQKLDFLCISVYFYNKFVSLQEHKNAYRIYVLLSLTQIMYKKTTFHCAKMLSCFVLYSRKLFLKTLPLLFKKSVG